MKGHRSPRLRLALIICGVAVFAIGVILLGNSFAPGFLQAARCTPAVRKLDPSCDIPPKPQEPLFHVAGVFLLVGATVGVLGIGSSLLEILRRRRSMRSTADLYINECGDAVGRPERGCPAQRDGWVQKRWLLRQGKRTGVTSRPRHVLAASGRSVGRDTTRSRQRAPPYTATSHWLAIVAFASVVDRKVFTATARYPAYLRHSAHPVRTHTRECSGILTLDFGARLGGRPVPAIPAKIRLSTARKPSHAANDDYHESH